jgi:hypothetical protein
MGCFFLKEERMGCWKVRSNGYSIERVRGGDGGGRFYCAPEDAE